MAGVLQNKKIAMIIAFRDFRDEEYFIPKQILEQAGAKIVTFSNSLGKAVGKLGGEIDVNFQIKDLNVSDYDAVLFVGGPGAHKYIDDPDCHRIARQATEAKKILGAICVAPTILAKSGVLEGKKATVWNSPMDKSAVKILQEAGATFEDSAVVIDGTVITAAGPAAAQEFAQTVINILK